MNISFPRFHPPFSFSDSFSHLVLGHPASCYTGAFLSRTFRPDDAKNSRVSSIDIAGSVPADRKSILDFAARWLPFARWWIYWKCAMRIFSNDDGGLRHWKRALGNYACRLYARLRDPFSLEFPRFFGYSSTRQSRTSISRRRRRIYVRFSAKFRTLLNNVIQLRWLITF